MDPPDSDPPPPRTAPVAPTGRHSGAEAAGRGAGRPAAAVRRGWAGAAPARRHARVVGRPAAVGDAVGGVAAEQRGPCGREGGRTREIRVADQRAELESQADLGDALASV